MPPAEDDMPNFRVCKRCDKSFPATTEFFVTLRVPQKNWTGFVSECRACRNLRYKPFYEKNRERLIAQAIVRKRVYRGSEEGRNYERRKSRYLVTLGKARRWHAVPPWADLKRIEAIYAIADFLTQETGIVYEVDHVHPLRHKVLCGLHVPWNLRVITQTVNRSKGNRLSGDLFIQSPIVL
jgi:5-methylcytosine-specific restriction endonuclease McrA